MDNLETASDITHTTHIYITLHIHTDHTSMINLYVNIRYQIVGTLLASVII